MSNLGESRADLLTRVRAALDDGRSAPGDPPAITDEVVRTVAAEAGLPAMFAERAVAVGMHVDRISPDRIAATLADLLQRYNVKRASVGVADPDFASRIEAALAQVGVERAAITPGSGLAPSFECGVGISDVSAAVAESGTLVVRCDAEHPRGMCIAPPVHIALVRADQILPDLIDLYADPRFAREWPASLLHITGPSKTADIEAVLVTGVHGPREVHVLLVDGAVKGRA